MPRALRGHVSSPVLVVGGLLAVLVLAAAAQRLGAERLVMAIVALACAAVLLARPTLAVGLLIVVVVGLENDPDALLHAPSQVYGYLPGPKVTGTEALMAVALASVAIQAVFRHRLWLPEPLSLSLLLVALALAAGAITGASAGSSTSEIIDAGRSALPLLVIPVLLVNVITTRQELRRWIACVGMLAAAKGVIGVLSVVSGNGVEIDEGGTTGTYLESAANILAVVFIAAAGAGILSGARMPRWVLWCAPLVVAALVLSFRRSFWIAAVVALLLVLVLASGRVGRRLIIPSAVVIGLLGWALVSTGVGGQLNGRVVERAESLSPQKVRANDQDRYRLSERANVLADLRSEPVAGLGLGRPWTASRPMPTEHIGGRQYVHFAALWWWMKCGLLGLAAYVVLLCSMLATAAAVARRDPDPRIRAAALGTAAAIVGVALAELTATFIGSEFRATVVVATLAGLLAAAWQLGPRAHQSPAAPRAPTGPR